jgi:hypothetical protein
MGGRARSGYGHRMGKLVNLNHVRKARAKAAETAQAAANRASHGRTLAEKRAARVEAARAGRVLDGAKRQD